MTMLPVLGGRRGDRRRHAHGPGAPIESWKARWTWEAAAESAEEEPVLAGMLEVILYAGIWAHGGVPSHKGPPGNDREPADLDDYSGESCAFDAGATKLALHSGAVGRTGEDTPMIVPAAVADVAASRRAGRARGVVWRTFEAPGITVAHGKDPEGNPIALEACSL